MLKIFMEIIIFLTLIVNMAVVLANISIAIEIRKLSRLALILFAIMNIVSLIFMGHI